MEKREEELRESTWAATESVRSERGEGQVQLRVVRVVVSEGGGREG